MEADAPLPPGATDPGRIQSFEGSGGRMLSFRIIEAEQPRHHILFCHGIESHGTWFLPAASRLAERGCTVWLLDRRGSGLNRKPEPGDAPSGEVLLEDVRRFRDHIGDTELFLCGLSWGGKLATAAALDRPDGVRGLLLITPGLAALVDLPLTHKLRLLLSLPFGGRTRLPIPIDAEMFTRTPRYLDFIRNDPWRLTQATARFLWSGPWFDKHIARNVSALDRPVLLFLAGGERIIDNQGVQRILSGLPDGRLETRLYEDATHSIQFDQVDRMVEDVIGFLDRETAA